MPACFGRRKKKYQRANCCYRHATSSPLAARPRIISYQRAPRARACAPRISRPQRFCACPLSPLPLVCASLLRATCTCLYAHHFARLLSPAHSFLLHAFACERTVGWAGAHLLRPVSLGRTSREKRRPRRKKTIRHFHHWPHRTSEDQHASGQRSASSTTLPLAPAGTISLMHVRSCLALLQALMKHDRISSWSEPPLCASQHPYLASLHHYPLTLIIEASTLCACHQAARACYLPPCGCLGLRG